MMGTAVRNRADEHARRLLPTQGDGGAAHAIGAWVAGKGREVRPYARARRESQVEEAPPHEAAAIRIERDHFSEIARREVRQAQDAGARIRRCLRGFDVDVAGQQRRQ